jgi:hypothetical protein
MNKSKYFILGMLVIVLALGMTIIGCDNGNGPGDGGGTDNQSGSVEATFTIEQFPVSPSPKVYYRFDWQAVPSALYYNIYRVSNGNVVKDKSNITNTTTYSNNETITTSNTAGRYYWVTAVLPGGETEPPKNKIIKFSWSFYTTNPYILNEKKVEYVPYSTVPITP